MPIYTNPICRKNQYDQVEEFYVDVREKGQRKEEESQEEVRKSTEQLQAVGVTGRVKCSCDFHPVPYLYMPCVNTLESPPYMII